jgi:hypothetical protein
MSRARHKKSGDSGGSGVGQLKAEPNVKEVYAGSGSNVLKEAKARKNGGRIDKMIKGKKSKMRLDRPGRKHGGRVGADKSPLSSAASVSSPKGHKEAAI